jgi:hypothetical protein
MNARSIALRSREPARRSAVPATPRMSALARESVDKARRHLLANERTAATLAAIEPTDLHTATVRTAAALEQLLAVARSRRSALARHKSAAAVPLGVQRYHALLLADAMTAVQAALPEMQRQALRLDVSGLNGDLSRFYAAQILAAPAAGATAHRLTLRFASEEPKTLERLLTEAGLSAAAIDDLRTMGQSAAGQIDVSVLAPGDRDYPGAAGGGGGGAGGGGGVGSSAVDAALGGLTIPKGVSGLIEGSIERVRGILDAALKQDWTYGYVLADGTPTMKLDFGPRTADKPASPGSELAGAGSSLAEIGGRLFVAGLVIGGPLVAIGMLLTMIGLLFFFFGKVWDLLGEGSETETSFVDP